MDFSHFDNDGRATMVDVSKKQITERKATATAEIFMLAQTVELIKSGGAAKGDVLGTAQIAGIAAAKKTSELIPMCHNVPLSSVSIRFEILEESIKIYSVASAEAKTGIEMEALTAASVAALTIYDMTKAVDKAMTISNVTLLEKEGGKSGHYVRR